MGQGQIVLADPLLLMDRQTDKCNFKVNDSICMLTTDLFLSNTEAPTLVAPAYKEV